MAQTIVTPIYEGAKSTAIKIEPFISSKKSNMGLENYNLVLFDGIKHTEQLACIEQGTNFRYITGLNEFAPEVKAIKNPEEKAAKIKFIRETVSRLEQELNANYVDPEDKEFWNKIVLLHPNNREFWNTISISCGNESIILDPEKSALDLIKILAIEAGGFSIIAKNYDDARSRSVPVKFYLNKAIDTLSIKTEFSKLKNEALSKLHSNFGKHIDKLRYVAKILDGNSAQYKKSTPHDVIYQNLDAYINGKGIETNQTRAIKSFLDAIALDMETLKLRALVKDASFYNILISRGDGFIYEAKTSEKIGKTPSECVEFFKSPLNDVVFTRILKQVESYWNQ